MEGYSLSLLRSRSWTWLQYEQLDKGREVVWCSTVTSKVSSGNSMWVYLHIHSFVKYDKDGEISGTDQVRFLLLACWFKGKGTRWADWYFWIDPRAEKANAVVDKISPLFVRIQVYGSPHEKMGVVLLLVVGNRSAIATLSLCTLWLQSSRLDYMQYIIYDLHSNISFVSLFAAFRIGSSQIGTPM